jgi:predicted RNase H-like HicB family nuclease
LSIRLGFDERTSSSHHIFRKSGIDERVNLQRDGNVTKVYEVRQVRAILIKIPTRRRLIMHKYEIILYWSNEDQVFVAEVPELPGCVAHGETQEVALANAQEATQLWIETALEFGDPIPQPKGRRLILA